MVKEGDPGRGRFSVKATYGADPQVEDGQLLRLMGPIPVYRTPGAVDDAREPMDDAAGSVLDALARDYAGSQAVQLSSEPSQL